MGADKCWVMNGSAELAIIETFEQCCFVRVLETAADLSRLRNLELGRAVHVRFSDVSGLRVCCIQMGARG